jgi:hypothetical protein
MENKQYPSQYEKQILIALSYYPELRDRHIIFRIRNRHTPLSTRSTWRGLLQPKHKRRFVITISDKTEPFLEKILFKNLPFNAQVGVIGHELGHVTDFSRMSFAKILQHATRHVSPRYVDRFEFRTDSICIAHGLGYQMLDWSVYVRTALHRMDWIGPDKAHNPMNKERYMNPSTIIKRIEENPAYPKS